MGNIRYYLILFIFSCALSCWSQTTTSFIYNGLSYSPFAYDTLSLLVYKNKNADTLKTLRKEYRTLHIPSHISYEGKEYDVKEIGYLHVEPEIDSIIIDEGIELIRSDAFIDNPNIKYIWIPASVKTIEPGILRKCDKLKHIEVDKHNCWFESPDGSNCIVDKSSRALVVGCNSTVFPNDIKEIGENAFTDCNQLFSVKIPEGVTVIRHGAFAGCSNLQDIELPNGLSKLYSSVFLNCKSLRSITIPESVKEITASNFLVGCSSLKKIKVSKRNKYFDSRGNCNAIIEKSNASLVSGCKTTKIPKSVHILRSECFAGHNIKELYIHKNIDSIEIAIVMNNPNLSVIKVDKRNKKFDTRGKCNAIIQTADNCLITGCVNSKIHHSVTSIGVFAFAGCDVSPYLFIPEGITSICRWAFRDCLNIKYVYIPASVKTIGLGAFLHCKNIETVNIQSKNIDIVDNAFLGCVSATILDANGNILPMKKEYW